MRKIQINVYQKKPNPRKDSHRDIQQISDVLNYMHRNNIHAESNFQNRIDDLEKTLSGKLEELSEVKRWLERDEKAIADYSVCKEISVKIPKATEEERKEYLRTAYCKQFSEEQIEDMRERLPAQKNRLANLSAEIEDLKNQKREAESMSFLYTKHTTGIYDRLLAEHRAEKKERQRIAAEIKERAIREQEKVKGKSETTFEI